VQSEEAVLGMVLTCTAARPGARQKAEAIAALLPCVRMPQLNVHALVHGVEANALLMAQPVTCVRPRPGRCMRGAAGPARPPLPLWRVAWSACENEDMCARACGPI